MHRRRRLLSGGVFIWASPIFVAGSMFVAIKFEPLEPWCFGATSGGTSGDEEGDSETRRKQDAAKAEFLEHIAVGQSVRAAAAAIGVKPSLPYSWRTLDEGFSAAWSAAEEAGTDIIEEEAFRRAVTGVEKPVYRGGEIVGHVADYSDAMLMFLLKSRRPERYGAAGKTTGSKTTEDLNLEGARDALISKFGAVASSGKTPKVS